MQSRSVISRVEIQSRPLLGVKIVNGMVSFARESKEPVSCRVCRYMSLIDAADREGAHDSLMTAFHGVCVVLIKRAPLLIYHNSVVAESVVANAVKFSSEVSLGGAEGVGGVDYN